MIYYEIVRGVEYLYYIEDIENLISNSIIYYYDDNNSSTLKIGRASIADIPELTPVYLEIMKNDIY